MRTAITGGIGSGKSYICQLLKERGISVYDCDTHAKRLMVEAASLRRQLTRLVGPEMYSRHKVVGEASKLCGSPVVGEASKLCGSSVVGEASKLRSPVVGEASKLRSPSGRVEYRLNKAVVARFLMSSPANAHALEDIVHPAVIDDFLSSAMEWVESAILFESGLNHFVDRIVVVTAPEEVRIARIMERDGITREKAKEWIGCQLPQDYLTSHADHIIVNDGLTPLQPQIEKLLTLGT